MTGWANPLKKYEGTKLYDLLAALPLVAWYVHRLYEAWPTLRDAAIYSYYEPGDIEPLLRFVNQVGVFAFVGTVIALLLLRAPPTAKAPGLLPRVVALLGTFLTVGYLWMEPVEVSPAVQWLATVSIIGGCFLGVYVLIYLGRSFSIMAEARSLRTRGPYALVRHPLYLVEELIVLGSVLQFPQPWATLLGATQFGFQIWRMINEERVLRAAFPAYEAYAKRTARLIPGVW